MSATKSALHFPYNHNWSHHLQDLLSWKYSGKFSSISGFVSPTWPQYSRTYEPNAYTSEGRSTGISLMWKHSSSDFRLPRSMSCTVVAETVVRFFLTVEWLWARTTLMSLLISHCASTSLPGTLSARSLTAPEIDLESLYINFDICSRVQSASTTCNWRLLSVVN